MIVKRFFDPFTISEIQVVASSSNDNQTSVGFNFKHGTDRTSLTNLYTGNHNASSSTTPQNISYGFSDVTLTDNEVLHLFIASASIQTSTVNFDICGFFDP